MDYFHYFDHWDINDIDDEQFLLRRRNKQYKRRINPLTFLDESAFKTKYRFSKEYIIKIVDLIRDDIRVDTRGGGISPELQVLTAVRVWGRQEVQDDAADLHGLSQKSITNICRRVATALARKATNFIFMPRTISEQNDTMSKFRDICGFRNVIGAIDCTHIRIKKVSGELGQFYVNRKGYYSLNVQVVCDASLKIRDIVARWRGSTHDARIFRESVIKERFENGEFLGRLIGDSGYALSSYLFTPLLNPSTPAEECYNRSHITTRNTVERCFGLWKQRFQYLLTGFTCSLAHAKLYIVALAVLHNIAIDMREEFDIVEHHEPSSTSSELPPFTDVNDGISEELSGQAARRLFIERYF